MQRNAARLSPRPDKLRIKSVLREKPGVRAPLDDSSLVKDQDEVRAAYGGKPVSDDECGALPRESGQCALHACFRDRIEGAGGFVQQENGRICPAQTQYAAMMTPAIATARMMPTRMRISRSRHIRIRKFEARGEETSLA